jgi:hypothetical protein
MRRGAVGVAGNRHWSSRSRRITLPSGAGNLHREDVVDFRYASASYLGGHFGSQHHVPRQRKDSLGFAGESFSCVGLTGFEPATT